jgi:hypothetical protein
MKNKIEVKLVESSQRWTCSVCGSSAEGSTRGKGVEKIEVCVCEDCIQAGDIDARLQRRAANLENEAAWVRGLVGRLKVPTFSDLQTRQAQEAQFAAEEAILQKQLEAQAEKEERQSWYEYEQWEFLAEVAEKALEEDELVVPEEPEEEQVGAFIDILRTPATEISATPEVGA